MQSIRNWSVSRLGWLAAASVSGALLSSASESHAQSRASTFRIAIDAHSDVVYMTDHTTAHGINEGTNLDRRSAGGGSARRRGLGAEIEHERSSRVAWLFSVGATQGRMNYKQTPGWNFSPPNIHSILEFNTANVSIGRRTYLKEPGSRARAFYDVRAGYEQLSANLLYAHRLTDTIVKTGGPMARMRIGSQFRVSEALSADLAFQLHFASYRGWSRSGHPIGGDPTRVVTWTVLPALRLRL